MLHEIDLEKKHYKLVKNVINLWKNKCYQTILFCVYKLMHYKLAGWIENKNFMCNDDFNLFVFLYASSTSPTLR